MKTIIIALTLLAGTAHAAPTADTSRAAAAAAKKDIEKTFGFLPTFMARISDRALPGVWDQMKGLQMNPNTALSGKTKELIGLAVSSQIPCAYCTLAHSQFGKLNGATDEQLSEAIALGGLTRFWSTFMNGLAIDHQLFDRELAKMLDSAKKGTAPQMPAFIPPAAQATVGGSWRELMELEMAETSISAKEKALISLGVASQIPCSYCIKADTAFAKLAGATDQEIVEAVALSALVRNMSTLLNGHQIDRAQFSRELDRLVANLKKPRS
jgi:AhpD family alkylhydroperoxidase